MKRTVFFLLITILYSLFTVNCYAQHYLYPENLPLFDRSPYHFGFILGVNSMDYSIHPVQNLKKFDTLSTVQSQPQLGFTIGIVSNLRLGTDYADLRFVPSLSFGARNMIYTLIEPNSPPLSVSKITDASRLEFPVDLKLKSMRFWNNYRAYVFGGVMYSIDMASQPKQIQSNGPYMLILQKYDYSFDIGMGFDIYTVFFKFGIDFRMEYGTQNLLKPDNTAYTESIQNLNSKIFLLSFTFE